jgi:rhodanese-related sulfurtransferase
MCANQRKTERRDAVKHHLFSNEACALLRAGEFQPYAQMDAALQGQLGDGVRIMLLRQGERLTTLGGTQISVLNGKVRLSSTGRTLNDGVTRARPFLVAARGDILQALEETALALADHDFLDHIVAWHELAQHAQENGGIAAERLAQLQRASPFRRLPLECVEAAFARMTPRRVPAGAEIVRQGTPGESFYALCSGRAEVWQQGFNDGAAHKLADLRPGDSFGEEALVTGGARQASVRMVSDGELLELPRAVFLELITKPPIQEVTPTTAKNMLDSGWRALDVRYVEEFEAGRLAGAQLLPLPALRSQAEAALSRTERYVIVCDSGRRSAAAALILSQRGYQVASLKHGLRESSLDLLPGQSAQQTQAVA